MAPVRDGVTSFEVAVWQVLFYAHVGIAFNPGESPMRYPVH